MDRQHASAAREIPAYRPLTERALDRLPGWRWPWIVGWSLLAGGPYYLTRLWDPGAPYPGDAFVVTATWGSALCIWGAGVVARRLDALQPNLAELLPNEPDPGATYRALGSARWPVILTLISSAMFEGVDFVEAPSMATAVRIPMTFLGTLAGMTFMWVLGALLVATYRFGTRPLALRPFQVDPGLGLKALGRLAFTGVIILIAVLGPVLIATIGDLRAYTFLITLLFVSVSLFFVSLSTLHRQAAAVKADRLACIVNSRPRRLIGWPGRGACTATRWNRSRRRPMPRTWRPGRRAWLRRPKSSAGCWPSPSGRSTTGSGAPSSPS